MIAIASICKDEADVAERWLQHHIAEGVDQFFIADASQDGTREILRGHEYVTVIEDNEPYCMQTYWMNQLIDMAGTAGATWIVCADVDEFFYACDGSTIANTLSDCSHDTLYARSYQQYGDMRHESHKLLPKVAFRWSSGRTVSMGNHSVTGPTGVYGVLDLRELQFRSESHFIQKVRGRLATLDPTAAARGDGAHYIWLQNKTDEELREEWQRMQSVPMVHDPIPEHLSQ